MGNDSTNHDLVWSSNTVPASIRGHVGKVYEGRRSSMPELLLDARRWKGRVFITQGGRSLNYEDHESAVAKGAGMLKQLGIAPGDRVMLTGVNSIEWVVAFWSILAAGGVAALGNFWWSAEELQEAISALAPRLVIADPLRIAQDIASSSVIDIGDFNPWTGRLGSQDVALTLPNVDENAPAMIVYTSGSSGMPKGVILSHGGVIASQQNLLASTRRLPQTLSVEHPPIVSLLTSPLFHLGGVGPMITALLVGGKLIFLKGKFDALEVLHLIESESVTVWGGVPTTMQRTIAHPSFNDYDTSSLRTIALGGAPVPFGLTAEIRRVFPTVRKGVSEVYGMTETNGFIATASGTELVERPGTTGRPLPVVEVRIDKANDNGDGEIVVRGTTVMLGYVGMIPDEAFTQDGYFRTGDQGRLDSDGFLYVTGRLKDVIIRGGENIAAGHVEEILLAHPKVREVAVVGLPHFDLGEEVGAIVVVDDDLDIETLREHAKKHLSYFEVPTHWKLTIEELPTTPFGKIDKKKIKRSWVESEPEA